MYNTIAYTTGCLSPPLICFPADGNYLQCTYLGCPQAKYLNSCQKYATVAIVKFSR